MCKRGDRRAYTLVACVMTYIFGPRETSRNRFRGRRWLTKILMRNTVFTISIQKKKKTHILAPENVLFSKPSSSSLGRFCQTRNLMNYGRPFPCNITDNNQYILLQYLIIIITINYFCTVIHNNGYSGDA